MDFLLEQIQLKESEKTWKQIEQALQSIAKVLSNNDCPLNVLESIFSCLQSQRSTVFRSACLALEKAVKSSDSHSMRIMTVLIKGIGSSNAVMHSAALKTAKEAMTLFSPRAKLVELICNGLSDRNCKVQVFCMGTLRTMLQQTLCLESIEHIVHVLPKSLSARDQKVRELAREAYFSLNPEIQLKIYQQLEQSTRKTIDKTKTPPKQVKVIGSKELHAKYGVPTSPIQREVYDFSVDEEDLVKFDLDQSFEEHEFVSSIPVLEVEQDKFEVIRARLRAKAASKKQVQELLNSPDSRDILLLCCNDEFEPAYLMSQKLFPIIKTPHDPYGALELLGNITQLSSIQRILQNDAHVSFLHVALLLQQISESAFKHTSSDVLDSILDQKHASILVIEHLLRLGAKFNHTQKLQKIVFLNLSSTFDHQRMLAIRCLCFMASCVDLNEFKILSWQRTLVDHYLRSSLKKPLFYLQ